MTISAKVIQRSCHPGCPDLYTLQLRYPRFIHAECKTHRVLKMSDAEIELLHEISLMDDPSMSRNASSSRAVPVEKLIDEALNDPAIPVSWGRNKRGMQADQVIERPDLALEMWMEARDNAVDSARRAVELGLHKQVANRLLEPFTHISVVVTATDWENFFNLRLSEMADPTMHALAFAVLEAMYDSVATPLEAGQWHTPYRAEGDLMGSAAACARVSYLNHDGTAPNREKDQELAQMLLKEGHMSPFEHQAKPAPGKRHANLRGWMSHRTMLGE